MGQAGALRLGAVRPCKPLRFPAAQHPSRKWVCNTEATDGEQRCVSYSVVP